MPLEGTQWTKRDTAKLCYDEGFRDADELMIMVAIVGAESAYFDLAWNHNPPTASHPNGTTDWGLFQLNDGGRTGTKLEEFKEMALDPIRAATTARQYFINRGFQPWAAFNNFSYHAFVSGACLGVQNMLRVMNDLPPV